MGKVEGEMEGGRRGAVASSTELSSLFRISADRQQWLELWNRVEEMK